MRGDLFATLGLVVAAAVVMIALARRQQQRSSLDRRKLIEKFLKSHPGPVELRSARGTLADPVLLTSPNADRVLEFLGPHGGEVWIIRDNQTPEFIQVPGWAERR